MEYLGEEIALFMACYVTKGPVALQRSEHIEHLNFSVFNFLFENREFLSKFLSRELKVKH